MRIQYCVSRSLALVAIVFMIAVQGCATGPKASLVLGQPDFTSNGANQNIKQPANNTMLGPAGQVVLFSDALAIADPGNNRILIFSPVPVVNNASAKSVIRSDNPAKWINFDYPNAVAVASGKMFVADEGNHRVLIWNKIPSSNESPDVVLGQPDAKTPPVQNCSHMNEPKVLFASSDKLIVADTTNNRILIWNAIPVTNMSPADLVLGNNDCSIDETRSTRHTFYRPRGVWTDGNKLVVADTGNNRLMIWNHFPKKTSDDADIVLGTGKEGPGRDQLSPYGVVSDGTRLFVTDWINNRVLVWNQFPTKDGDLPDTVIGQRNFDRVGVNGAARENSSAGAPKAYTLYHPQGVSIYGKRLWVADSDNNRVLLFNLE